MERCCERSELGISLSNAFWNGVLEIEAMGNGKRWTENHRVASEQPLEQDHSLWLPLTRRGVRLTRVFR